MAERTDELKRALLAIRDLRKQVQQLESGAREPIAVVGVACRLPGGVATPEDYWDLLRNGVDATTEMPRDRWDVDALYDPDPDAPGKMYTRRGGFLEGPMDRFDAGFFGISPREAAAMDPVQRLLLELSWEALERAGIAPDSLAGSRTGVFVGVSGSDYDTLQHEAETLEDIDSYRGTGSAPCVTGGRLSYVLGLHGPNISVDTACSSSLTAVALAVEGLRAGTCEMAIAGGAHLMLAPESTVYLCRMRALSPGGRCRTFDADADGYARGEGGALFVLKRLSRAQAAGDPILAVIRGAAINHDGRSSGLTVPNPAAQRAVIQAALADADLRPESVDYVEAHGTATPLGDPIEVRAVAEVLARARPQDDPLLIGSVKTNFGHLEAAAGAAGLLKLVLAVQHGEVPPHLNCDRPTPHVDWDSLPVRISHELRSWPERGHPPIAGVSAFGFSGTNAHVIVERAPERGGAPSPTHPAELIAVSGRSAEATRAAAGRYADLLSSSAPPALADLAVTSLAARAHFGARAFVVADGPASMRERLAALAAAGDAEIGPLDPPGTGPVAFLFTGQGAQYPAMARELVQASPFAREVIERCAGIVAPHLDIPLDELLTGDVAADTLNRTEYAQPALFVLEYTLAELWRRWGVEPAFLAGHSLGEYVAAVVAGVMSLEDALPLIAARGRLMGGLPTGGAMAAVLAPEAVVLEALRAEPELSVAAFNAAENVVVSGPQGALDRLIAQLAERGVESRRLHVSHAFHSGLMEPVLAEYEAAVQGVRLSPPRIPIISNLTGRVMTPAEATDPARWSRHLREPVRFADSMAEIERLAAETFIEVGPHPALIATARAGTTSPELNWIASMRRGRGGWAQLLEALGEVWRLGGEVDVSAFAADHGGRRVIAPTYPFQRERHWFTDNRASGPRRRRETPSAGEVILLGRAVRSPAVQGWIFESTLSSDSPAFLGDHRVGGQVIVPGAASLEMMIQAARHGPGWSDVELRDVTFERPLVLRDAVDTICQVLLDPVVNGSSRARVVTPAPDDDDAWVTVARAQLMPATQRAEPGADADSAASEQVDVDALYAALAARGIDYGPSFRTLREASRGAGQASGRVELAREADATGYAVHPCLLDGAMHLLAAVTAADGDEETTYLPSGIAAMRVFGSAGHAARAHVRADQGAHEGFSADIRLVSPDGAPVVELAGFRAEEVRGLKRPSRQLHVEWSRVDDGVPTVPLDRIWAVIGGDAERRGDFEAALRAGGAQIHSPPAGGAEREGLAAVGVDGVVVLPPSGGEGESGVDALTRHFERLLDVLDGVLNPGGRLILVSEQPESDDSLSEPRVEQAGTAGLHGSLRAEREDLRIGQLLVGGGAIDGAQLRRALAIDPAVEDRLRVRSHGVFAPRLMPGEPVVSSGTPARIAAENYELRAEPRGTLEILEYVPSSRPAPGPGEVEVRVRYTGLNFRDVLNVLQAYDVDFGNPGLEVSGRVTRVGAGVLSVAVGDEVIGIGSGLFTGYATLRARSVVRIPAGLTSAQAATIPVAFLSAEWGLRRAAGLRAGERVLIHAAAGGVGQAAVQIARACGAEIFATAGSEAKREILRSQGIEHVFDSRSVSFADDILRVTDGEGVDVVLNSLTGELMQRSLELLREGGRFVEMGVADLLTADEVAARYPGVRYTTFQLGALPISDDEFREMFMEVAERFARGEFRPMPHRVFGPDRIVDAFHHMAQAQHVGKVLISSAQVGETLFDPQGSYLVTGGTGGVGRSVAEWLVSAGAGRVVLSGRSAPDPATEEWIAALNRSGARVEWISADVGDSGQVERLVGLSDDDAFPLRGVFHAAGVVDDGLLSAYDGARFERLVAGKVGGAIHLDRATRTRALDHFVLFSSTAALVGGPGQAAYGAANAALAEVARWRVDNGLPGLCVHWGAWGGAGMMARLGDRERALLEAQGLELLEPAEALAELTRLLTSGAREGVVARIRWDRVRASLRGRANPLLSELLGPSVSTLDGDESGDDHSSLGAELRGLAADERDQRLGSYLVSSVATVLRIRPERLNLDSNLAHSGFDSLMAVELRNRLEQDLAIGVPVARLLASDTPRQLLEWLTHEIDADGDGQLAAVGETDEDTIETFDF